MSFAAIMAMACVIDAVVGWPDRVWRRIGHPVSWIGCLITALDNTLNHGPPARRLGCGALATALVIAASAVPAMAIQSALPDAGAGLVLGAVCAWPLIAARSLYDHIAAVARPLARGDVAAARRAVSMVVGRDPAALDGAGIARSALESLAENASDGVVAPVFWGAVAGLPGIAVYKAINTLDSMIGHKNARYTHFGRAAARLDDVVNLIPARLTGLAYVFASGTPRRALAVMWRDARQHRSPNAGWPEAAMAGGLGLRLSGPRIYGERVAEEPWLNGGAPDPDPHAITRGLALYVRAMLGLWLALLTLAVL